MKNNITIKSWLRKNNNYESMRSVPVKRLVKTVTAPKKLLKRSHLERMTQRKEKITHQKMTHSMKMEHQLGM
jgi:hypothetical protein